jgi:periplasmic divalent cation tolerance protein
MTPCILYTTFADLEQVRAFAGKVLDAELAACVNALPQMRAFYRWQGELHDDPEVACLIKTRSDLKEPLLAFAREHHPYETPALLWFETDDADPAFAAWIREETGAH